MIVTHFFLLLFFFYYYLFLYLLCCCCWLCLSWCMCVCVFSLLSFSVLKPSALSFSFIFPQTQIHSRRLFHFSLSFSSFSYQKKNKIKNSFARCVCCIIPRHTHRFIFTSLVTLCVRCKVSVRWFCLCTVCARTRFFELCLCHHRNQRCHFRCVFARSVSFFFLFFFYIYIQLLSISLTPIFM